MDATPAHAADINAIVSRREFEMASRACGATIAGLLVLAAIVVGLRRLAGALTDPLPWPALLVVGIVAISAAAAARWLWGRDSGESMPWQRACIHWVPRVALIALGMGLFVPGSSWWVAAPLVAGGVASDRWLRPGWRRPTFERARHPQPPEPTVVALPRLRHDSEEPIEQQLIRSLTAEGIDKLEGTLRAHFVPRQRTAWVHAAFCPPFGVLPQLVVRQTSGPEARITVGSLLPYGVRFDLKLVGTSEQPSVVDLEFTVSAKVVASSSRGEPGVTRHSALGQASH